MIRFSRICSTPRIIHSARILPHPAVYRAFSTSQDKNMNYYIREELLYRNNRYREEIKWDLFSVVTPIISAGLYIQGYNVAAIAGMVFWSVWFAARMKAITRSKRLVRELHYDPATQLVTIKLNDDNKEPIVTRLHQVDFHPPRSLGSNISLINIQVNDRIRHEESKAKESNIYDMFIFVDAPMVLNKDLFIALTSKNLEELNKYEWFQDDKQSK